MFSRIVRKMGRSQGSPKLVVWVTDLWHAWVDASRIRVLRCVICSRDASPVSHRGVKCFPESCVKFRDPRGLLNMYFAKQICGMRYRSVACVRRCIPDTCAEVRHM